MERWVKVDNEKRIEKEKIYVDIPKGIDDNELIIIKNKGNIIDETLKGDLKIVGVRPISEHYFNLYDENLKNIRKRNKPGFIPPYYVDLPKSFDEIMSSEMKYFKQYEKNPCWTDFKYLFLALRNVIFKGIRSN